MDFGLRELNSKQGLELAKNAIHSAEGDYIFPDEIVYDIRGKNGIFGQITGNIKLMFPLKMVKAEFRIPRQTTIQQENYLQVVYNLLNGSGALNQKSLKGILLRELFSYSVQTKEYEDNEYQKEFNEKFANNQINLQDLWHDISLRLTEKIDLSAQNCLEMTLRK